ncbi:protein kinase family protein [Listeria seeligeri]|uniref:protein kinase family protein n=1 Tax=Listeria seeligeri TaxID=1640 RepID=UPI0010F049C8|nr:protein kinase family protein [Listeria seeligeri]MBC2225348.1 protein kinase family protein [Listeria seeligeri]MBF2419789.1 protein kinase family protein [Listeria seeligeri]
MRVENFIESQYRELGVNESIEYLELYTHIEHEKLQLIFSSLHSNFISLFKSMNDRLPTKEYVSHFWAEPSRDLIRMIDITQSLYRALKSTKLAFVIDEYYNSVIENCNTFLSSSGGSEIPAHMDKIELYYTIPIFQPSNVIVIDSNRISPFNLKAIGNGSYANVFKYHDENYDTKIALKRALKTLNINELKRFKEEFSYMKECNSPYIVDVYKYYDEKNEYTMEYMDSTLHDYIEKNNSNLTFAQRKNIGYQILKAFSYIHSKNLLHRDISPKNILVKLYEDTIVVKVSDFGLVKNPELQMTSMNTEIKGYFNDPSLQFEGFNSYNKLHETYALTRLLFFVMSGRTNTDKIKNSGLKEFVETGLNPDKEKRFKDCESIRLSFSRLNEDV